MKNFIFFSDTCSGCHTRKMCRQVIIVDNQEDRKSQFTKSICASCLPVQRDEHSVTRVITA